MVPYRKPHPLRYKMFISSKTLREPQGKPLVLRFEKGGILDSCVVIKARQASHMASALRISRQLATMQCHSYFLLAPHCQKVPKGTGGNGPCLYSPCLGVRLCSAVVEALLHAPQPPGCGPWPLVWDWRRGLVVCSTVRLSLS